MTTLRLPAPDELPEAESEIIERVAKRMAQKPADLSRVWQAQFYWPQLMEANYLQTMHSFFSHGQLPRLTKEAMHVAVSMANRCEF